MIEITAQLQQDDCPFVQTARSWDVRFSTLHWEFDQVRSVSESRVVLEGPDTEAVDQALSGLVEHETSESIELLSRGGRTAQLHTQIGETAAMAAVRDHGGYIIGPFNTHKEGETWHMGFDREAHADGALAALDRENELTVMDRSTITSESFEDFVDNIGAAMTLIEGAQELSDVERETLEEAVNSGYFSRPRSVNLGDLAAEFDVSKPAVSKNLRRGQEKLLERVVDVLNDLR